MGKETRCISKLQNRIVALFVFVLGVVYCSEDFSLLNISKDCFPNVLKLEPQCEFWISNNATIKDLRINCVPPVGEHQKQNSLKIEGDFHILKINCTANFPVDFIYYGTQPSEAMFIEWSKQIIPKEPLENQNYTVDVQIYSNQALFDHFNDPKNSYYENANEGLPLSTKHIYSRSGNYSFPGIFNQSLGRWFHLFLEDLPEYSFLRNSRTVTVDIKLVGNARYLSVPCLSSHLDSQIEGQGPDGPLASKYWDPVNGFLVPIQATVDNATLAGDYNCTLMKQDGKVLDTILYNYRRGVEGNYFTPLLANNSDQVEINGETPPTPTDYVRYIYPICKTKDPLFLVDPEQTQLISVPSPNFGFMRHVQHFALPKFVNKSYTAKISNGGWDPLIRDIRQKNGVTQRMGTVYCSTGTTNKVADFGSAIRSRIFVPFNFGLDWAKFNRRNSEITVHFGIRNLNIDKNIYINSEVILECRVNVPVLVKPVVWYLKMKNGSLNQDLIDYNLDYDTSIHKINISKDLDSVQCASSYWYSDFWRNISFNVGKVAKNATPPRIVDMEEEYKFQVGSISNIPCSARGEPAPEISFQKDGQDIYRFGLSTVKNANSTLLLFPKVAKINEGIYTCIAKNIYTEKQEFRVVVDAEGFSNTDLMLVILIPLIVCVATIVGGLIYIRFYRKEKTGLTKQEVEDFMKGLSKEEAQIAPTSPDGNDYVQVHEFALMKPYVQDYEIPPKRFTIDESKVLGKGQFGLVLLGSVDNIDVAVKTVQRNADKQYLKALLSELKIMIHLGQHDHLVPLIGACTKDLRRGFVYVFVKYLPHGNLQSYLRNNKSHFNITLTTPTSGDFGKGKDPKVFSLADLNLWCQQTAGGMEYLASKHVIHGDLATRNVLLDENKVAKVTDFGLSRQLYDYNDYIKKQQEPLPWRWMALESLKYMTFSKHSDMWAFGVTMWEIFALGEVPYPGYSWNMDFIDDLENGLRMGKPKYASPEQFALMYECWNAEPSRRPSFADVKMRMKKPEVEESWIEEDEPVEQKTSESRDDPLGVGSKEKVKSPLNTNYENVGNNESMYLNI